MAVRVRRRASRRAFDRAAYAQEAVGFQAELNEARFQVLAGLTDVSASAAIYARHADLFSADAVDALRRTVESGGDEAEGHRALLAFATDGYLELEVDHYHWMLL